MEKNKKHKKTRKSFNGNSKEPNDGTFIHHPNDSFSSHGTVRYGEEADADDL